MTSEWLVTLGGVAVLIIGALSAFVVAVINALSKKQEAAAIAAAASAEHLATKVDAVAAKADVIAGHVNSAATASVAKIDALERRIESLTRQLAKQDQREALLAQSVAAGGASTPAPSIHEGAPVVVAPAFVVAPPTKEG